MYLVLRNEHVYLYIYIYIYGIRWIFKNDRYHQPGRLFLLLFARSLRVLSPPLDIYVDNVAKNWRNSWSPTPEARRSATHSRIWSVARMYLCTSHKQTQKIENKAESACSSTHTDSFTTIRYRSRDCSRSKSILGAQRARETPGRRKEVHYVPPNDRERKKRCWLSSISSYDRKDYIMPDEKMEQRYNACNVYIYMYMYIVTYVRH